MSPLPIERMKPAPAWSTTSIDMFGPFMIRGQVNKRARSNKIIPYYVCDVFVKMSGAERLSKLNSKNLCTGAVKGPKHRCFFTNFCCPSNEHDEKIHILLCENQKKDDVNIKLLAKCKDKFIKNSKKKCHYLSTVKISSLLMKWSASLNLSK